MRDMNLTYLNFERSFRQQLNRKLSNLRTKDIKILRSAVIDSPTFLEDYELRLPNKFHQVQSLCICWDQLPENIRFEVFLQLKEKIKRFDYKKQVELTLLLEIETRFKYLYFTQRYTSHQIFGNMIQESIKSIELIKIIRKNTLVIKPQRKRGYDDKGTLRSYDIWCHRWTPSFDWSLTELQNKLERTQYLQEKHLNRIIKFLRELN